MAKSTPTKAKAKAKAKPVTTRTAAATATPKPKVTVRTASARQNRFDYKSLLSGRVRDIKVGALIAEVAATFTLTSVVMTTSNPTGGTVNTIIAALTVLVVTVMFWRLSGGHANPAITVALWAGRQITGLRATGYVIAQILGAMLAVVVVTQFINTAEVNPLSGELPKVFTVQSPAGDWRPFLAEGLGALVLGWGIAASRFGRRDALEAGWLIGGSLLLGMILALQGSSALLNPALAFASGAYHLDNWWTVWTYALAPAFGASVGVWIYKAMQWEISSHEGNAAE